MALRRGAELAVQAQLAFMDADAKLILVRVKKFDAIACAFGERQTMPGLLHRPVLTWLALTAPAGDFELRSPRVEVRRMGTVFHEMHGSGHLRFLPRNTSV